MTFNTVQETCEYRFIYRFFSISQRRIEIRKMKQGKSK